MTTTQNITRTETERQTDLHLALAHVVIDCDAQPKASSRYHSVRASAPVRKANAARPTPWPALATSAALLTMATALMQML